MHVYLRAVCLVAPFYVGNGTTGRWGEDRLKCTLKNSYRDQLEKAPRSCKKQQPKIMLQPAACISPSDEESHPAFS